MNTTHRIAARLGDFGKNAPSDAKVLQQVLLHKFDRNSETYKVGHALAVGEVEEDNIIQRAAVDEVQYSVAIVMLARILRGFGRNLTKGRAPV